MYVCACMHNSYLYMCMYIYIYVCVCIHVYKHIYIYIHMSTSNPIPMRAHLAHVRHVRGGVAVTAAGAGELGHPGGLMRLKSGVRRCPFWFVSKFEGDSWLTWWFNQLPGKSIYFPKKDTYGGVSVTP